MQPITYQSRRRCGSGCQCHYGSAKPLIKLVFTCYDRCTCDAHISICYASSAQPVPLGYYPDSSSLQPSMCLTFSVYLVF